MITKKQANKTDICWQCKECVDSENEVVYYIWASPSIKNRKTYGTNNLSIKIAFHKACFEYVAGEQYLFEGY